MHSAPHNDAKLDWLQAGDHVCQLYHEVNDIPDVLVPYFKAGLARNESCLWIAGEPYGVEQATSAMRSAVADFDQRVAAGQMRLIERDEWHSRYGALRIGETIRDWLVWKDAALGSGYAGVRSGGDLSGLYGDRLHAFLKYERAADKEFRQQPIAAVCCYCLRRFAGKSVLDAMHSHGFGLAKLQGDWRPVEIWRRGQRSPRVVHPARGRKPRQEVGLVEAVEDVLCVYALAYPGRIALEGRDAMVEATVAARLRVVLRELIANAVRFGALSAPDGELSVKWHVAVNGSRRLRITWREQGVAGLTVAETIGLGTQLIVREAENYVRSFESTAMSCTFELPLG
jgi:hypothetical protein